MEKKLWVLCFVVLLGIFGQQMLTRAEPQKQRQTFLQFPTEIGSWSGSDHPLPQDILDVLRLTDYLNRNYARSDGPGVWLYIAYYDNQRNGIYYHTPRGCLPGSGWQFLEFKPLDVSLRSSKVTLHVNKVVVVNGLDRQVLLYWYQDRGRVIASDLMGKLYSIRDAIVMNRTDGALVRISAPFSGDDYSETLASEIEFLDQIYPTLPRFIPS